MKRATGFSLIELMIVVIIIGVLLAISVPAYQAYVMRSHRTDATQQPARYRSTEGYYTLGAAACAGGVIANCYTITATAVGSQANDTGCTSLTYNSVGTKTPAACW